MIFLLHVEVMQRVMRGMLEGWGGKAWYVELGRVWKSGEAGFVSGVGWIWGVFGNCLGVEVWRR